MAKVIHPSIELLPMDEREPAIAAMATDLREGRLSPTDVYADVVQERERAGFFSRLMGGTLGGAALGAFCLASGYGPFLALLLGAGVAGGNGWAALKRLQGCFEDIEEDYIGDWLTDQEWDDLEVMIESLPDSADPDVAAKAKRVLDRLHEDGESAFDEEEALDVEAEILPPDEVLDFELDEDEHEDLDSPTVSLLVDHDIPDGAPSTIFKDGEISPEFLAMPIKDRAALVLKELKKAGCDIEQFVGDQLIGATGNQRSGKTSALMCLSILESALLEKEIVYLSCDDDIYPVRFAKVYGGNEEKGKAGYRKAISNIQALRKDGAHDKIWFFDECTKTLRLMGKDAGNDLWNALLTGFLKTGGSVRMVMHGKTATAMGIPSGYSDQAKSELLMLGALWARQAGEDYQGTGKYPSGKYQMLEGMGGAYEPTGETFTLPSWLLFAKGSGSRPKPCYVHSMLALFPELDKRVQQATQKTTTGNTFGDDESATNPNEQELEEYVNLLERIAKSIREQCDASDSGHITVRAAAQCLSSDVRDEHYPHMKDYCAQLEYAYPAQFLVFSGRVDEDRVAFKQSSKFKADEILRLDPSVARKLRR